MSQVSLSRFVARSSFRDARCGKSGLALERHGNNPRARYHNMVGAVAVVGRSESSQKKTKLPRVFESPPLRQKSRTPDKTMASAGPHPGMGPVMVLSKLIYESHNGSMCGCGIAASTLIEWSEKLFFGVSCILSNIIRCRHCCRSSTISLLLYHQVLQMKLQRSNT